jgi:hypothetical protein
VIVGLFGFNYSSPCFLSLDEVTVQRFKIQLLEIYGAEPNVVDKLKDILK